MAQRSLAAGILLVACAVGAAAQPAGLRAPPAPGFAAIAGAVDDSLRGGALGGATVTVLGTARSAVTDPAGLFRIDSIPPGEIRLFVRHPLLDSLLVTVTTGAFPVSEGRLDQIVLATPTLSRVRAQICPRGGVRMGDAMLAGRVDDAETGAPLANALVSLVYTEPGTAASNDRVRNARTDAEGRYAICGLPETITGNVQAAAGASASAEIPVEMKAQLLATASFLIGSVSRSDSGSVGSSVLTGRVTDVAGRPLQDAQVAVEGGSTIALTGADGSFTLRALPSGTTTASVRKIGFSPGMRTVHLRSVRPETLSIALTAGTRTLAPVTITAKAAEALDRVGFNERLKMGNRSNFMFPDDLDRRQASKLTDIFRTMPGFLVSMQGQYGVLQSSRAVSGGQEGCVNIFVDKIAFQQVSPGDLDAAFPAYTIAAIESYPSAATVPSEFRMTGRSCATVVIWTKHKLNRQ